MKPLVFILAAAVAWWWSGRPAHQHNGLGGQR